jgi:hypothetical protein
MRSTFLKGFLAFGLVLGTGTALATSWNLPDSGKTEGASLVDPNGSPDRASRTPSR